MGNGIAIGDDLRMSEPVIMEYHWAIKPVFLLSRYIPIIGLPWVLAFSLINETGWVFLAASVVYLLLLQLLGNWWMAKYIPAVRIVITGDLLEYYGFRKIGDVRKDQVVKVSDWYPGLTILHFRESGRMKHLPIAKYMRNYRKGAAFWQDP